MQLPGVEFKPQATLPPEFPKKKQDMTLNLATLATVMVREASRIIHYKFLRILGCFFGMGTTNISPDDTNFDLFLPEGTFFC